MKKMHNKGIINTRNSLLYVIPVLVVYAICTFVPLIQDIYYSFTDWKLESMTYDFVGIKNYLRIFRDGVFLTDIFCCNPSKCLQSAGCGYFEQQILCRPQFLQSHDIYSCSYQHYGFRVYVETPFESLPRSIKNDFDRIWNQGFG